MELVQQRTRIAELEATVGRLRKIEQAAQQLAAEFHAMHEEQREKLIVGQTLESAAENWGTLYKTMAMQPLLDALTASEPPHA